MVVVSSVVVPSVVVPSVVVSAVVEPSSVVDGGECSRASTIPFTGPLAFGTSVGRT